MLFSHSGRMMGVFLAALCHSACEEYQQWRNRGGSNAQDDAVDAVDDKDASELVAQAFLRSCASHV